MAITSDTLGDLLLKRYTEDFIAQLQRVDPPVWGIAKKNQVFDLETVIKECSEDSFEDLLQEKDV